jgi:hypothetical protein
VAAARRLVTLLCCLTIGVGMLLEYFGITQLIPSLLKLQFLNDLILLPIDFLEASHTFFFKLLIENDY